MSRYWENETPVTVTTPKNIIQFYPKAGKLSVARIPWTDNEGKERPGKTVCLDLTALVEADADNLRTARKVFAEIGGQIGDRLSAQ